MAGPDDGDTRIIADKLDPVAWRLQNSSLLLIAANLVPLFGVLFLDWDLFLVLALFWLENVVIGFFGILRVLLLTRDDLPRRMASAVFFIIHYGGFMFAHAMLLLAVFGESAGIEGGVEGFREFLDYLMKPGIGIAILALFVAHGGSFLQGLSTGREQAELIAADAMALPYRRVVVTQLGLIVGALLVERLDQPVAGLVALVAVKILLDLRMQRKEQEKLARDAVGPMRPSRGSSRRNPSARG